MLANEKYVGKWAWGATTTVRNSTGNTKQKPVSKDEWVVRDRPDLVIIDRDTWDRAQRRLAELVAQFGLKDGHKKRGPKVRPTDVYPRSTLGGLLVCVACESTLHYHGSGGRQYYACSGHKKGMCQVATHVPAAVTESALTRFLTDHLAAWPDWLRGLFDRARDLIRQEGERRPEQHAEAIERLAAVQHKIKNLILALAEAKSPMSAVEATLSTLQQEANLLEVQVEQTSPPPVVELPNDKWLSNQLQKWVLRLDSDACRTAVVLRQAIGPVTVEAVIKPGKKRGHPRLRFRVNGWAIFRDALGDRIPDAIPNDAGGSPEFVLDLATSAPAVAQAA